MKRKFYSIAIAIVCLLTSMTASAADYVTVSGNDGTKTSFTLSETPTVTFTDESLVITAGSKTVEYPRSEYRLFQLTDNDQTTTAINNVKGNDGDNVVFSFADGVHGEGLKAGSRVAVYSINGQLIGQAVASASGSVDIPLQGTGVFIVKSQAKTFKFVKRD